MSKLDRLATAAGVLAAVFLSLIGIIIALQIGARLLGKQIPSSDDFAAWAMAASLFLALPYALRHGDHIRVTIVLQFMPARFVQTYEVVATLVGLGLSGWCSWHATHFVYESYVYQEVASGMVAVPLWIPQLAMPIGLTLFTAMLAQRLVRCLRGQTLEPSHG